MSDRDVDDALPGRKLWSSSVSIRDLIGLLAGPGPILRFSDEGGADLVTYHGHVSNEDISCLCDNGWLYSMNGTYRLTDEGRVAFNRSTDELGNGKLIAPWVYQEDARP